MATQPARPFPESYRQLNEFAARYPVATVVYARDTVPEHCYILLTGHVVLEGNDEDGRVTSLGEVLPGQMFGHVAAFDGRPASTGARVTEDAVIISVPIDRANDAFRLVPELAVALLRDLARRAPRTPISELPPPLLSLAPEQDEKVIEVESEESGDSDGVEQDVAVSSAAGGWAGDTELLDEEYDESFFFKDTAVCPACETNFEYLRVRNAAVRPKERESDFRVTYRSEDPTRYVMVVCPTCSYAATHDDFAELSGSERDSIVAGSQERGRFDYPNLGGTRTLDQSETALKLGLMCYDKRGLNERRHAGLLQRFAWLERERGNEASELEWLSKSRDAYMQAFEHDGDVSDEAAMRLAYLIGDLCLRLGDANEGVKWLETATRFPQAKDQSGLERMARDRLGDARKIFETSQDGQKSA